MSNWKLTDKKIRHPKDVQPTPKSLEGVHRIIALYSEEKERKETPDNCFSPREWEMAHN